MIATSFATIKALTHHAKSVNQSAEKWISTKHGSHTWKSTKTWRCEYCRIGPKCSEVSPVELASCFFFLESSNIFKSYPKRSDSESSVIVFTKAGPYCQGWERWDPNRSVSIFERPRPDLIQMVSQKSYVHCFSLYFQIIIKYMKHANNNNER